MKYTNMSSEDYRVQNTYKYSRKTYKKNRRGMHETDVNNSQFDKNIIETDISPRGDPRSDEIFDSPGCSCDLDPEVKIDIKPHRNCPVTTLAQQQLQRLLDETDKLLCDNTRCCRFIWLCKEILANQYKHHCIVTLLISGAFFIGIILGAAACGYDLRQFNSSIFRCLDKLFMLEGHENYENIYYRIF